MENGKQLHYIQNSYLSYQKINTRLGKPQKRVPPLGARPQRPYPPSPLELSDHRNFFLVLVLVFRFPNLFFSLLAWPLPPPPLSGRTTGFPLVRILPK